MLFAKVTPITTPFLTMKIEEIVQPWYKHFLEVDEQVTLREILLAANHMDIQPLIDLVWLGMSLEMEVRCLLSYTLYTCGDC